VKKDDGKGAIEEYQRGRPEYPSWGDAPWSEGHFNVPIEEILRHVLKTVALLRSPANVAEEHASHTVVISALTDVLYLVQSHPDRKTAAAYPEIVNMIFNLGRLVGESTVRLEDSPMYQEPRKRLSARKADRSRAETTNQKKRDRVSPMRSQAVKLASHYWEVDSDRKMRTGDVVNKVHTELSNAFGEDKVVKTTTVRRWLGSVPGLIPDYAKKKGLNRIS